MSAQKWTTFFKSFGIVIRKRGKTLKKYNYKSDMAALRRVGVNQPAIDDVFARCGKHSDELLFKKFSKLFKKDIPTIKVWLKVKSASEAFVKLFDVLDANTYDIAKSKISELFVVFEFYKKGVGQVYNGKIKSSQSINSFNVTDLLRRLNRSDNASYVKKGATDFGSEKIIRIEKLGDQITNKFIKLSKNKSTLHVSLSFDSKKEYSVAKSTLEKKFDTYLDTPESTKDFTKFIDFLKTGTSNNFILTGTSYLDSEFRITAMPANTRIVNLVNLNSYKARISSASKKMEVLTQVRLTCLDRSISKPIFLSILTYRDGIFGAVLLRLDDKRLTANQRDLLHARFKKDFGFSLNEFLIYDDLTEQAIYKHFLQTRTTKSLKVELRSKLALSIYSSLLTDNLLSSGNITEEISKVCVNNTCQRYFKPIWESRRYCQACGDVLINGKGVELRTIDESNVSDFIKKHYKNGSSLILSRQLLSRQIFVCELSSNDQAAEFIPVTKALSDNQIEVLKIRYPHAVIVTTNDDVSYLQSKGCLAVNLWEFVHSIKHDNANAIQKLIKKSNAESLNRIRNQALISLSRISDDKYYKERNAEVKNLGAELFEADISILFDYVLGNSLWLGAKHRGSSVPDGFTAFPMLQTSKGCFIWDGKFSEGRALVMGNYNKNKTYIDAAKKNQTIKDNGGLRGFLFISNNTFPVKFSKKYLPLTKKRRLKISFLRSPQLKMITEHYQVNEKLIMRNSKARDQFTNSLEYLFFSTSGGRKCEIIPDADIVAAIKNDVTYFKTLKAGKSLKV